MADETVETSPIEDLLEAGLAKVIDKTNAQTPLLELKDLFIQGITEKIEEINFGLYALSPQEEKMLFVFRHALENKPPGTKLKLIAVGEANEAGLVDAGGKPLSKEEPQIVIPK